MTSARNTAQETAHTLLRLALVAKLGVDLDSPALARNAAGQAKDAANLLAGLAWTPVAAEEAWSAQDGESLPEVEELYAAKADQP